MNFHPNTKQNNATTLIEIVVVLVFIGFLALMFIPAFFKIRAHDRRVQCVNNLVQIGLAFRNWENNHGGKYPFDISLTNNTAMELAEGPNEFKYFQMMSNELSTPKILLCPSDQSRKEAANFSALSNSNLGYFLGLNVTSTDPNNLASGDRNITNGTPIKNGILELTTNTPAGWTAEMHNKSGFIVLSDGSVQMVATLGLRAAVVNSRVSTNRLLMPILGP